MTEVPLSACPTVEELERALEAGPLGGDLRRHVDACAACMNQARQIGENLAFMRGVADRLGPAALESAARTALVHDAVPGYRIIREVARGGQGSVYEAVQLDTKRHVAMKIVDVGDAGANSRRRFEREVELAASLRHPNIVSVYHSTALPDGRHALAMEYVDGVTLDQWAANINAAAPPTPEGHREAVRLKLRAVATVCDAVQHAHVNGVIHRDLKPANVLVAADGTIRVVDFGIARRVSHATQLTRTGSFAGTLSYASPEQVSGQPDQVDTRTDVYSLGLILYEVLAGRRPYETDGSLTGAIANIVSTVPPPIERLQPGGLGAGSELEAIVSKALAKDRSRRYQSAAALRADLENWLSGRVIDARQSSTIYVLRKMASRHRMGFGVAVGLVVLITGFAIAMTWSARRLAVQRSLLAASLSSSTIERGRSVGRAGENASAEELIWPELIRTGVDPAGEGILFDSPSPAMQAACGLCELYSRQPSLMLAAVPPGSEPVRFEEGRQRLRLVEPNGAQHVMSIPDGAIVSSTAALTDTPGVRPMISTVREHVSIQTPQGPIIVSLATGERTDITDRAYNGGEIWDIARDGTRFVSVSPDSVMRLWRTDPPRLIRQFPGVLPLRNKPALRPDGEALIWGQDDRIGAWRMSDGALTTEWRITPELVSKSVRSTVYTVRMNPAGTLLAAGFHNCVLLFDVADPGALPRELTPAHRGFVGALEYSADGSVLASHGLEQSTKIWDPESGELRMTFEHRHPMRGRPVLSDDGMLAAVGTDNDLVRVFETRARGWLTRLGGAQNSVHRACFSADGSLLAAVASDGSVRLWRAGDRVLLWSLPVASASLEALSFSRDGRSLAVAGQDGVISVIDIDDEQPRVRALAKAPVFTTWLGHAPDGRTLIALAGESSCLMIDSATGRTLGNLVGHAARVIDGDFSPDGRTLYTVGGDGLCIAWDLEHKRERFRTMNAGSITRAVAASPDGRVIATGSDDWTIRLWDAENGRLLSTMTGARQQVFGLAFHPDGNVLFSCGRDSSLQVWDLRTRQEIAILEGHEGLVLSVELSPDGRTLATASADRTVGLWDLGYYRRHLAGNAAVWRSRPLPAR